MRITGNKKEQGESVRTVTPQFTKIHEVKQMEGKEVQAFEWHDRFRDVPNREESLYERIEMDKSTFQNTLPISELRVHCNEQTSLRINLTPLQQDKDDIGWRELLEKTRPEFIDIVQSLLETTQRKKETALIV